MDGSWEVWADQVGAGLMRLEEGTDVVREVNRRAAELLGVVPERVVGRSLGETVPEVAAWASTWSGARGAVRGVRITSSGSRGGGGGGEGEGDGVGGSVARWVDVEAVGDGRGRVVLTVIDATARVLAEGEAARLRGELGQSERARQRLAQLQQELDPTGPGSEERMVGSSLGLRRVRDQIERIAPTNSTVLIQGETGTGKELVARLIHRTSPRASRVFVPVNCAAMPESLIESELFGHERGAFTGADRRRLGKFELADGGTLFLDEVAELPLGSQAKLLRVLQDGCFERVGGAETIRVDVRLVAATHRDLARQVERGRFREDLFYRLNVLRVDVPPLRERREDLRLLAEHLHERTARRLARPVLALSEASLRRLMAYSWPGNVRELANAIERATLLADGPELEVQIPESPLVGAGTGAGSERGEGAGVRRGGRAGDGAGGVPGTTTRDILLDLTLEQLQRLHITHALEASGYRVFGPNGAAARLDLNPSTLLSRMDRYGIPRPRLMRRRDGR